MLKKTPFYQNHIEAGGKVVPFAGFEMPIQYKGIIYEVKKVRTTVGIFDVSHMGRIEIEGHQAIEFISKITTNDPSKLETFQAQYSCMCYPKGGIVDDILVYRLPDKWLLVVNASNKLKDYDWMVKNKTAFKAEIIDVSNDFAQLAIQGPKAETVLQSLIDIDLSSIKYYWGANGKVAGIPAFISRTGYTGEDGFELYFPAKYGSEIWANIMQAGSKFEIEPVGLGARDTLRLEVNYCLYGNDIDKTTTPLEAGLGWITKLDKSDFIGRSVLLKQKETGVSRKLTAFIMETKAIPRQHYKIFCGGTPVGEVTSGSFSPSLNRSIGLGYIKLPYNKEDTEIEIECRDRLEKAKIIKPPFYTKGSHK